ncbi:MAG: glutathione S-transferase family protein [Rhizobiaceae bacterium]
MTILLYDLVGADENRPFSPHCWKVTMSLAHKGLPFESVPTSFTKVPVVEGGFSPTVPVIRDGDKLVRDSYDIALYLDRTYPDRPSLFGGPGGEAMCRFIERWSQTMVHPFMGAAAMLDIYDRLSPEDQVYFRESREKRNNGRTLEAASSERDQRHPEFLKKLEPLRNTLSMQPFLGGNGPLFADYIVFGAFQWVRIMSPFTYLPSGDPILDWFERCLDLHGGLARKIPAAA